MTRGALDARRRAHAADDRHFVRKGVNRALRNIGKRSMVLDAAALACARRILADAHARAGEPASGDAGARSARWVAGDAIRELERVALHKGRRE
ncbi:MAG: hypothetical protein ACJ8IK_01445 [Burkholderiaceae bacterium]